MSLNIKQLLYRATYYTRAYLVFKSIYSWCFSNPIRILFAHDIINSTDPLYEIKQVMGELDIVEFKKRVEYLLKHYEFVSLDTALRMLECKPGERRRNCIVLTFDDGYRSIYTRVYPILKGYGIPATVFLTTDFIRETSPGAVARWRDLLWYDQIMYAVAKTPLKRIVSLNGNGPSHKLSTLLEKKIFIEYVCDHIKQQCESLKRETLSSLLDRLGFPDDELLHVRTYSPPVEMLSWQEIEEMFRSGLVSFGAHTKSHPILTKIPASDAEGQIIMSKKCIEAKLGTEVIAFAYPNGGPNDFNQTVIEINEAAGFRCACTTIPIGNSHLSNKMTLGRFGIEGYSWHFFALRIAGFHEMMGAARRFLPGNRIIPDPS